METTLQEIVRFRSDRLFDGAVDIEWFLKNKPQAGRAAAAYVFHGPTYHGVSQSEIGTEHGHRLVDSATFLRNILTRCGSDEQPFTLAIAGYGTGKSHLAVTLATLLSDPDGKTTKEILTNLEVADGAIAAEVRRRLKEIGGSTLVVTLNGMGNFDLAAEVMRQIILQLRAKEIDTRALDELRPRFRMAANMLKVMSAAETSALAAECGVEGLDGVVAALNDFDETVYEKIHRFFETKGIPIKAMGDETVKDVLATVCRDYCGEGKPFRSIVLLFDEFGRYAEFATTRSQVAGSGALQHLFEGVQANAGKALFVGFIQFDLNTYVQRMGQEFRNEILRVSTRYQSADKAYLSINLETLMAHLLEKVNPDLLDAHFGNESALRQSVALSAQLCRWFPRATNHTLWHDPRAFHRMVRKGCWPLSPYAAWFLFHLAAAGQHLQQRSALALLGDAFNRQTTRVLDSLDWEMAAVDLWSDMLLSELLASEEAGSIGTIAHSYAGVMERNSHHFGDDERRLLQAIVLSSKMGMKVENRRDAAAALAALSRTSPLLVETSLTKLEMEFNVISWDDGFRQFEILGDAVSRPQFLAFLRQRVASAYDDRGKSQLFIRHAREWGGGLLSDQVGDFAETHRISTQEWRFQQSVSNLEELPRIVQFAVQNWREAYAVDAPRGTVVYCYVESGCDLGKTAADVAKLLREQAKAVGVKAVPVLVVLLHDADGKLGQYMAELTVLGESLTEQEKVKFGNLVGAHREKCLRLFNERIEQVIKERHYATGFSEPLESRRMAAACGEIFERIYTKVLPFHVDGFSTAKGNAADTCKMFVTELLNGTLDYDTAIAKPIKEKNRAVELLSNSWKVFSKSGEVSRIPANEAARAVVKEWERMLADGNGVLCPADAIKTACQPPYGANLASAGVLLGVFVRARKRELSVTDDGVPTDFLQIGDGIFKGKFLDLQRLQRIKLVPVSQESASEWDRVLDEWEQATKTSYKEMVDSWKRATELKQLRPVPSVQVYRYDSLESRSRDGDARLQECQAKADNAISRINMGEHKEDVRLLTFGGALLKELQDGMRLDPMWDAESIAACDRSIENARQRTIQLFDRWLPNQTPEGQTSLAVSKFERELLFETGRNLKKLGLNDLHKQLEERVGEIIRNLNAAAETFELVHKVGLWLQEHGAQNQIVRIATLRYDLDVAKGFGKKLDAAGKRFTMPAIDQCFLDLGEFAQHAKEKEREIEARAKQLRKLKLTPEDLGKTAAEVADLERIYEGCDSDLADLRIMASALGFYMDALRKLSDNFLNEDEFSALAEDLKLDGQKRFAEHEPPWLAEETVGMLAQYVSNVRTEAAKIWLESITEPLACLSSMDASTANSLHEKLQRPPPCLPATMHKQVSAAEKKVRAHLQTLEVDWLIARYGALTESAQEEFRKRTGMKKCRG